MSDEAGAFSAANKCAEIINPFVHKLELESTYDKIKTGVCTVVLLPFRVCVICALMVAAWLLACLGLAGLSERDLREAPMAGWRRSLKPLICLLGRLSYLAGGMAIAVRGRQARRAEAPILVVAPHSSFLDSCIVYATNMSSVIVRKESMDNYVGKLINYTQPVYVWRDDPNSRQNTIREIIQRATSDQDWPQVLIFPEGTTTNRSCLISFKAGAFYPGVPVQPVVIRYPNARDTVTWTWEGPGALKVLWLTLTQVHSTCEIEFLPVYEPSAAERRDPRLYANNVRDVMAKALGVPVVDYTYDDCVVMARARSLGVPHAHRVIDVRFLRTKLGMDESQREVGLSQAAPAEARGWATPEEFARLLQLPLEEDTMKLFNICAQKVGEEQLVFVPDYLLCADFLALQQEPLQRLLECAFKLYSLEGDGRVGPRQFSAAAARCLGLCQEDAANAFEQADALGTNAITYEEFVKFARGRPELQFVFGCTGGDARPRPARS